MEQIVFTGMDLVSLSRAKGKGTAVFTAALTADLARKMEWGELPEFLSSAHAAETELAATEMTLRSKDGDLASYEISLNISRVHSFELIRRELEGKRGKGKRLEIRFKVSFVDVTGCAHLEQYETSGATKGTLTVKYNPKAVQGTLPQAESKQPTLHAAN